MEDGLLSLKWNNHKSTFFHILGELRGKQTYTDATLACEGKFFPVHKLVMSTCSDYFGEIFEKTPCKNPVVVLKDIQKADLDALLDYMYIGEVDVRQSDLAGLIKAAECLRIKGLAVPDEDPSKVQKKGLSNVPERREESPPAKRKKRDSGDVGRGRSPPSRPQPSSIPPAVPSQASSSSHSQRTSTQASPVPDQSPRTPSQVPSQPLANVHGSDTRHVDSHRSLSSGVTSPRQDANQHLPSRQQHDQRSTTPGNDQGTTSGSQPESPSKSTDSHIFPVPMIKVEVEDGHEDNTTGSDRHRDGDSRGEDHLDDTSNDFPDYLAQGEIEKEEHDQADSYGAEQIPGPSGLQGAHHILGWGEEGDTGFPHNLFGEDPAAQQQAVTTRVGEDSSSRLFLPPSSSSTSSSTTTSPPTLSSTLALHSSSSSSTSALPHVAGYRRRYREAEVFLSGMDARLVSGSASSLTSAAASTTGLAAAVAAAAAGSRGLTQDPSHVSFDALLVDVGGKKCYSCSYCGKTFDERWMVKRHERIHTGERPYACPLCSYRSAQKYDVTKHLGTVHRMPRDGILHLNFTIARDK
ncbi:uncharacterized protein LOC143035883 isoform X2 [Oratosquilla oratoria]|uniref:uncharacterized protein LOC143035883 isoform X2 n=1 Tax=Oratosquilla oratoria TaxID=337810 RepID=UPI003F774CA2